MKVTAAVLALFALSLSAAPAMASVSGSSDLHSVAQATKHHHSHHSKKHKLADVRDAQGA